MSGFPTSLLWSCDGAVPSPWVGGTFVLLPLPAALVAMLVLAVNPAAVRVLLLVKSPASCALPFVAVLVKFKERSELPACHVAVVLVRI